LAYSIKRYIQFTFARNGLKIKTTKLRVRLINSVGKSEMRAKLIGGRYDTLSMQHAMLLDNYYLYEIIIYI